MVSLGKIKPIFGLMRWRWRVMIIEVKGDDHWILPRQPPCNPVIPDPKRRWTKSNMHQLPGSQLPFLGVNPKIMGKPPQIIPFVHRVWNHYIHHPFWGYPGTPIFGLTPILEGKHLLCWQCIGAAPKSHPRCSRQRSRQKPHRLCNKNLRKAHFWPVGRGLGVCSKGVLKQP